MKNKSDISVLILAGQREGVSDPLCELKSIDKKAILPILGKPMIDYPLDALEAFGLDGPYHISGFDADYDARLVQAPSAAGPAESAAAALGSGMKYPVLVLTCDHALLSPEILEAFLEGAQDSGADFCAGLADETVIQPAYPHVKRTYLRFSDRAVSGCNLFYVANEKGVKAVQFWKRAQSFRKRPVRLALSIGFTTPIMYLAGMLSLSGAFRYASRKIGIVAKPVIIPIAEAAIDVDKPSDLELVETILSNRRNP